MEALSADGSYEMIGCAMRVQNELGFGLREKPYENALVIELEDSGFAVEQQLAFPIVYKNRPVGDCIPDIALPRDRFLIEVKAVDEIGEKEQAQMLNYLRISSYEVGLVINFGRKVEWKRFVM